MVLALRQQNWSPESNTPELYLWHLIFSHQLFFLLCSISWPSGPFFPPYSCFLLSDLYIQNNAHKRCYWITNQWTHRQSPPGSRRRNCHTFRVTLVPLYHPIWNNYSPKFCVYHSLDLLYALSFLKFLCIFICFWTLYYINEIILYVFCDLSF